MPVVTRELLEEGMSRNGGWNRQQLEVLGVSWPLQSGWRRCLLGKVVSAEAIAEFLALRDAHLPAKEVAVVQKSPAPLLGGREATGVLVGSPAEVAAQVLRLVPQQELPEVIFLLEQHLDSAGVLRLLELQGAE